MRDPLWVTGTCDRIMLVLLHWTLNYRKGTVSATGKYMTKPGEAGPAPKEVDLTTRFACDVTWNYNDLEYLVKILETKVPGWPTTKDFRRCLPRWKNGRLAKPIIKVNNASYALPSPVRIITMDYYDADIIGMYRLLEAMRDGKTKEARKDLGSIDLATFTSE